MRVAAGCCLTVRGEMANLSALLCRVVFSSQNRAPAPLSLLPADMAVEVATE